MVGQKFKIKTFTAVDRAGLFLPAYNLFGSLPSVIDGVTNSYYLNNNPHMYNAGYRSVLNNDTLENNYGYRYQDLGVSRVYARWVKEIKYDGNGVDIDKDYLTPIDNNQYLLPGQFVSIQGVGLDYTNGSKTFLGWSTNSSDTVAMYTAGQQIREDVLRASGATLYAIWQTPQQIQIIYDPMTADNIQDWEMEQALTLTQN